MEAHDKVVIADIFRARLFPYMCGAILCDDASGGCKSSEGTKCMVSIPLSSSTATSLVTSAIFHHHTAGENGVSLSYIRGMLTQ